MGRHNQDPDEIKVKIILLGSGNVGKTELLNLVNQSIDQESYSFSYFADKGQSINTYTGSSKSSLGVAFSILRFTTNINDQKINFKIMFFDTAGQEIISTLRKRYYSGVSACLIVFSINERQSFGDIDLWLEEVDENVGQIPFILIGTDNQIRTENNSSEVSIQESNDRAKMLSLEYGFFVPYLEIHLISGTNKEELIEALRLLSIYEFISVEYEILAKRNVLSIYSDAKKVGGGGPVDLGFLLIIFRMHWMF